MSTSAKNRIVSVSTMAAVAALGALVACGGSDAVMHGFELHPDRALEITTLDQLVNVRMAQSEAVPEASCLLQVDGRRYAEVCSPPNRHSSGRIQLLQRVGSAGELMLVSFHERLICDNGPSYPADDVFAIIGWTPGSEQIRIIRSGEDMLWENDETHRGLDLDLCPDPE